MWSPDWDRALILRGVGTEPEEQAMHYSVSKWRIIASEQKPWGWGRGRFSQGPSWSSQGKFQARVLESSLRGPELVTVLGTVIGDLFSFTLQHGGEKNGLFNKLDRSKASLLLSWANGKNIIQANYMKMKALWVLSPYVEFSLPALQLKLHILYIYVLKPWFKHLRSVFVSDTYESLHI